MSKLCASRPLAVVLLMEKNFCSSVWSKLAFAGGTWCLCVCVCVC
uniref:Uncharacterized protein n=1 Tax=Anguilla anguilla TaxID=7936 RepID=A0A0E9PA23_ANGAN